MKRVASISVFGFFAAALAVACSSSSSVSAGIDAGPGGTDAGEIDLGGDGSIPYLDASDDAQQHPVDGGFAAADGGVVRADRFIMSVVSASYGPCAGFGQAQLPGVVQGPPIGGGDSHGSLDVLSLGTGGTIVVAFGANAIIDGTGPDFIVFENPFRVGGGMNGSIYAEPGEVSVSDDGTTWTTFPCTATAAPYGACAGWHPVYSTPDNGISPFDVANAGGDAFDLKDVGVTHAKFIRIVDKGTEDCPAQNPPNQNGFDLDAIAIVNAETP